MNNINANHSSANNNNNNISNNYNDNIYENNNNVDTINNNNNELIISNNDIIVNNTNNIENLDNNNSTVNKNNNDDEDIEFNDKKDIKKIKNVQLAKQKDDNSYTIIDENDEYFIDINDYNIISPQIGKGSFGIVHLVENSKTHKKYAAKVKIKKAKSIIDDFLLEIQFYKKFQFPTILKLHGYSMKNFKQEKSPVMMLEYMPKRTLQELFENFRKNPESKREIQSKIFVIIIGIIKAIEYLHSKGVVHRDLKPSNILLDENYYVRVSYFRSSIIYSEKNQWKKEKDKKVGTPLYMAPEIFLDKDPYSYKVDVYSFSMIAYELMTGNEPFYNKKYENPKKLIRDVINGVRPDLSNIPDDEIQAFFQRCWSSDPSERPSFSEILSKFESNRFKLFLKMDENEYNAFTYWCCDYIEDSKKNISYLKKASSKGDIKAMIDYAIRLYNGYGVPVNRDKSSQLLKKAAESGDIEGMFHYGVNFLSLYYLKKAADNGHAEAMVQYGVILLKTGMHKEAAKYYKKAADLENAKAMFNYGYMLFHGKGVDKNREEAATYFQLSADLGEIN